MWQLLKEWETAWQFWNDWLQQDKNTAGQRYINCPPFSLSSRIVSDEHVLPFSSWDVLHRVSGVAFPLRQELFLPLCDRRGEAVMQRIGTTFHRSYVTFTAPWIRLRGRISNRRCEEVKKWNLIAVVGSAPHSSEPEPITSSEAWNTDAENNLQICPPGVPSGPKLWC